MNLANASNITIGSTSVSAVYLGNNKIWPTGHDYSRDYLTIVSLENNNAISIKDYGSADVRTISVSTDGGQTWSNYTSSSAGTLLATLNSGDELLIKGSVEDYNNRIFVTSGYYNVQGNIMSYIYGDNFIGQTTLTETGVFGLLFRDSKVVSAENLILPATTLSNSCYSNMFYRCTSLTTPPELPATTLANYSYSNMFYGCTSLTTAPELPATTLVQSCYGAMFNGCTSLATAPELPATTLSNSCYESMFSHCSSLTTPPELPATTLAQACYRSMFYMCSSLTTAPELPATTLFQSCYYYMFGGCTSLNYIKCLATDISAQNCTQYWTDNVASTGTFVKDANTTWSTGTSGIPTGWTVQTV